MKTFIKHSMISLMRCLFSCIIKKTIKKITIDSTLKYNLICTIAGATLFTFHEGMANQ